MVYYRCCQWRKRDAKENGRIIGDRVLVVKLVHLSCSVASQGAIASWPWADGKVVGGGRITRKEMHMRWWFYNFMFHLVGRTRVWPRLGQKLW